MIHESISELARRNYSTLIKAMLNVTQARVADLAGLGESALSRMKDGELERFCAIASACNLVLQPRSFKAIDPERLRALEVLARCALDEPSRTGADE